MLRCQHHVSDAESGVRPGGENRQFSVRQRISFLVGQTEIQLGTFRTADPVDLLRLDPVDEIQFVQVFNQSIGIFGNRNHPLFFVLAHHFGTAALAAAVDHFFVGQSHFAGRTPVDGNLVLIGQTFFKKLDKHPLRPFVIFRITGGYAAVPVKAEADRFQLPGKVFDVGLGRNRRMHAGLDRIVFGRQPEGVKAHRIKHVKALHPFFARHHVKRGIGTRMPHVQPGAGRIGKFDQNVKLLPVAVDLHLIGLFLVPYFLPFAFDRAEIISFFHFPFFPPFGKRLAVMTGAAVVLQLFSPYLKISPISWFCA